MKPAFEGDEFVSDSRQQSYYEIALTNRQVMGVFVVLLVCVLGAFLAGVWVGREGLAVVATVEPQAISSGVTEGETPLEELDFFDRGDEPTVEEETVPPADASQDEPSSPVIIEELGGSESEERPAQDVPLPPPPSISSEPPRSASPVPDPVTAATGGDFVVQVFSSSDEEQAKRVLERLLAGEYPAQLSPVDVDGRPMYRVRVGPYVERADAQEIADRIRRTYRLDTWITR